MNIQGKILDENNKPLPAAAVFQSDQVGKLTGRGTTTRIDGTFDLTIKVDRANPGFITFRFLGYRPLTIPATTAYTIIQMEPDSYALPPVDVRPEPVKKKAFLPWLIAGLGLWWLMEDKK